MIVYTKTLYMSSYIFASPCVITICIITMCVITLCCITICVTTKHATTLCVTTIYHIPCVLQPYRPQPPVLLVMMCVTTASQSIAKHSIFHGTKLAASSLYRSIPLQILQFRIFSESMDPCFFLKLF